MRQWRIMALREWGPAQVGRPCKSADSAADLGAKWADRFGWLVWIETAEWEVA
jgi:hypothetical protein